MTPLVSFRNNLHEIQTQLDAALKTAEDAAKKKADDKKAKLPAAAKAVTENKKPDPLKSDLFAGSMPPPAETPAAPAAAPVTEASAPVAEMQVAGEVFHPVPPPKPAPVTPIRGKRGAGTAAAAPAAPAPVAEEPKPVPPPPAPASAPVAEKGGFIDETDDNDPAMPAEHIASDGFATAEDPEDDCPF